MNTMEGVIMLASTNREDILDQVNKYKCLTFKTTQLHTLYGYNCCCYYRKFSWFLTFV